MQTEQILLNWVAVWVLLVAPCTDEAQPGDGSAVVVSPKSASRSIVGSIIRCQGGIPERSCICVVVQNVEIVANIDVRNATILDAGRGIIGVSAISRV